MAIRDVPCNLPLYTRKYKEVEFLPDLITHSDLGVAINFKEDNLKEAYEWLKKIFEQTDVSFKVHITPRAPTKPVYQLTSSDKNGTQYGNDTLSLLMASYIVEIFNSGYNGVRLGDRLTVEKSLLVKNAFQTRCSLDSFDDSVKSQMPTFLTSLNTFSHSLLDDTKMLTDSHVTEATKIINQFTNLGSVKSQAYVDSEGLILLCAMSHVDSVVKFFGLNRSTSSKGTTIKNADKVDLPELLSGPNDLDVVKKLGEHERLENLIIASLDSTDISAGDIFARDKRFGSLCFNNEFNSKFFTSFYNNVIHVLLKYKEENFRIQKRIEEVRSYINNVCCYAKLVDSEVPEWCRKLIRLYFNFNVDNPVGTGDENSARISIKGQTLESLKLQIDSQRDRLQSIVDGLVNSVDKWFEPVSQDHFNGWVLLKGFFDGKELIYRLTKLEEVISHESATFFKHSIVKTRRNSLIKVNELDFVEANPEIRLFNYGSLGKSDSYSLCKRDQNAEITEDVFTSTYGTIVANVDVAKLIKLAALFYSDLEFIVDIPNLSVSSHIIPCGYTIMPPSIGKLGISFGNDGQRRENSTSEFRLTQVNPSTNGTGADLIDVLMMVDGRGYINSTSEQLEIKHDEILAKLVGKVPDTLGKRVRSLERLTDSSDIAIDYVFNSYENRSNFCNRQLDDFVILPQNTSTQKLINNKLPAQIDVAEMIGYEFFVDEKYVLPHIREVLVRNGIYKSIVDHGGIPNVVCVKDPTEDVIKKATSKYGEDYTKRALKALEDFNEKAAAASVTPAAKSSGKKGNEPVVVSHETETSFEFANILVIVSINVYKSCNFLLPDSLEKDNGSRIMSLDYKNINVTAALRHANMTLVHEGAPVSLTSGYFMRDQVKRLLTESVYESCFEVIANMLVTLYFAKTNEHTFGSFIKPSILKENLEALVDHIKKHFFKDLQLSLLYPPANGTVGDFCDAAKAIIDDVSACSLAEIALALNKLNFTLTSRIVDGMLFCPIIFDETCTGLISKILRLRLISYTFPSLLSENGLSRSLFTGLFKPDLAQEMDRFACRFIENSLLGPLTPTTSEE